MRNVSVLNVGLQRLIDGGQVLRDRKHCVILVVCGIINNKKGTRSKKGKVTRQRRRGRGRGRGRRRRRRRRRRGRGRLQTGSGIV